MARGCGVQMDDVHVEDVGRLQQRKVCLPGFGRIGEVKFEVGL